MNLSASIVIHDTPSTVVEGAIVSILYNFQFVNCNCQLYLLDNSVDGRYDYLAVKFPLIIYRRIPNHGFGAGHNIALREVILDHDYHLVLNPDVRWSGDILSPLIEFMEANPVVGLIAPKVINPDGSLQYTARNLPSPLDLFANRFLPEFLCKKRLDKYLMRTEDPDKPRNVPYLMGCFMLFRSSALQECGIFDERFFLYPEDIDITRRIHQKFQTLYWPYVSIIHQHTRASIHSLRLFCIHLYNIFLYYNKWR